MRWQTRFDRLLKAMAAGEPHKAAERGKSADKRQEKAESRTREQ